LVDHPWRDIFQTINHDGKKTDVLLVNYADLIGLTGYNEPIKYYANRYRSGSPAPIFLDAIDPPPPTVSDALAQHDGAWLLVTDGELTSRGQIAAAKLGQMGFSICQKWGFNDKLRSHNGSH